MTPEYKAKLEAALTRDDWQYIEYAVAGRFRRAKPQPGEPKTPMSPEFAAQERRIMSFLQSKAFSS